MSNSIRVKVQMLSAEGERVRVRFDCGGQNQLGDFLLKPDHPIVQQARIGAEYDLTLAEVGQGQGAG